MPAETHNECCAKDEFTLCLKTIVELYPYIIKDLLLTPYGVRSHSNRKTPRSIDLYPMANLFTDKIYCSVLFMVRGRSVATLTRGEVDRWY